MEPGLSKSLKSISMSMASFELVSKAGEGSSDSALWLKVTTLVTLLVMGTTIAKRS